MDTFGRRSRHCDETVLREDGEVAAEVLKEGDGNIAGVHEGEHAEQLHDCLSVLALGQALPCHVHHLKELVRILTGGLCARVPVLEQLRPAALQLSKVFVRLKPERLGTACRRRERERKVCEAARHVLDARWLVTPVLHLVGEQGVRLLLLKAPHHLAHSAKRLLPPVKSRRH